MNEANVTIAAKGDWKLLQYSGVSRTQLRSTKPIIFRTNTSSALVHHLVLTCAY